MRDGNGGRMDFKVIWTPRGLATLHPALEYVAKSLPRLQPT
jgi:hypothetical protein